MTGFEGAYEVSDRGRVRSLTREVQYTPKNRRSYVRTHKGKMLAPKPMGKCPYIYITIGPHPRTPKSVAHIVLEAFVGPRPEGQVSRHLNDIHTDNRLVNLAWGTYAENVADAKRNGTANYSHLGAFNLAKTNCPQGHPYDEENTRVFKTKTGWGRACRTCARERAMSDYYAKKAMTDGAD